MSELNISEINIDNFNPFGATAEELLALALDEAGLLSEVTKINETSAKALCKSLFVKRDAYKELTKLGNILIKKHVITAAQLNEALEYQRQHNENKLGNTLLALNMCKIEEIERCLDIQNQIRDDIEKLDNFQHRVLNIKNRLRKYI
ncbi:MAG: hypothetical protein WCK67_06120 [bacterium]